MPHKDQSSFKNRLLTAMPFEAFGRLSGALELIDLPVRHDLVIPNEPTTRVVFIESGLASVVARSDEESVEVGHIGPEGVTAAHLFLGTDTTPNSTFMQVAGSGAQIEASLLLDLLGEDAQARSFFLRYVHSYEIQLAQSALANARYNMNERMARWLLMCHDRLQGDDLPLTHEFLALMLGVRRSGVTNEMHVLEGFGALRATRGRVRILDRAKLEDIAAGCYGLAEREYERLIGVSLKAAT